MKRTPLFSSSKNKPVFPFGVRHLLPLGVLVLCLGATLWAWGAVKESLEKQANLLYAQKTNRLKQELVSRLKDHEQVLLGGLGLFAASREISRAEWQKYVAAIRLDQNYPGILGVGYAVWLKPSELARHQQKVQAEGFSDYQLHPLGERENYTSIIYLEPFHWRNQRAFGYDMYSEPTRRAAMDRAKDQGGTSLSGKITLVQETEKAKQQGFLLYLPLYKKGLPTDTIAERHRAIQGFVYSPIRMNDFVLGVFGRLPTDLSFHIFDGSSANPSQTLFDSGSVNPTSLPLDYRPRYQSEAVVHLFGHSWTYAFSTLPEFEENLSAYVAHMTLVGGLLVSLLLTWIILNLQANRERALALAEQMTLDLRTSEEGLKQSQRHIEALFNTAPVGVLELDRSGVCILVNPWWETITGTRQVEALGQGWLKVFGQTDPTDLTREWEKAVQGETLRVSEFKLTRPNGSEVWVILRVSGLFSEAGELNGFIASLSDITDRKRVEEEQATVGAYTRSLIESSLDPFLTITPEGTISDVNEATVRVTGIAREKLIGTQFCLYFTDPEKAQKGYSFVFERGEVRDYRLDILGQNGQVTPVIFNGSVYKSLKGGVGGVFAAARDISQLVQTEKELQEAKLIAEAASEAKGSFLANMSHEIRTPLNAILGMTQLAFEAERDESQKELLTTVVDSANSLLAIINDILDFSKIESGKLSLEHLDFSLAQETRSLFKGLEFTAQAKGLELTYKAHPNVPDSLCGDPLRIRQVLTNLVGNAIKFTPSGRIEVLVEMLRQSEEGLRLQFSVSDTGIGIKESQLDGIFESFNQAQVSTTRVFGGTGLGLTICRQIARMMKGEVWATSVLGQGSTFYFTCLLEPARGEVFAAEPHQVEPPDLSGLKLLVVEDNPVNRKLMSKVLQGLGIKLHMVSNGREALDLLVETRVDLVLMDLQMPVMDGIEATLAIRGPKSPVLDPQVPVIALTADVFLEDKKRCLAAGMNDFLSKPFQKAELFRLLSKIKNQKQHAPVGQEA